MAVSLLAYEVSDLCLGKPSLRSFSSSATVSEALAAIKSADENTISIWSCDHRHHSSKRITQDCLCVGKLSMVDVICYLSSDESLTSPSSALKSPVSVLLSKVNGLVRHVEPSVSLLEAIDLILQGAQNLVVPIKSYYVKRKQLQKSICPTNHNGQEFCWLTQEDIVRFLLSSIGLFSPISMLPVDSLGIITQEFLSVEYHSPAPLAIKAISQSLLDQTSVAVIDEEGALIGEISPVILGYCDETAAAAVATLSAGDLMAYMDCGGPPDEIVRIVKTRLKERNLECVLEELAIDPENARFNNSSSSDDELPSPTTMLSSSRSGRHSRSNSYSARMMRRSEAIICHPGSSLVAVMIQAITHRVNYVWVIEEDCSVVGIVTFANMLHIFREYLESLM